MQHERPRDRKFEKSRTTNLGNIFFIHAATCAGRTTSLYGCGYAMRAQSYACCCRRSALDAAGFGETIPSGRCKRISWAGDHSSTSNRGTEAVRVDGAACYVEHPLICRVHVILAQGGGRRDIAGCQAGAPRNISAHGQVRQPIRALRCGSEPRASPAAADQFASGCGQGAHRG